MKRRKRKTVPKVTQGWCSAHGPVKCVDGACVKCEALRKAFQNIAEEIK